MGMENSYLGAILAAEQMELITVNKFKLKIKRRFLRIRQKKFWNIKS